MKTEIVLRQVGAIWPPLNLNGWTSGLVLILIAALIPRESYAQGRYETIARTGDVAPDGNGTYFSFRSLMLNDMGVTSFRSIFSNTSGGSTDSFGVLRSDQGAITQIMRTGQTAPDGNGVFSYDGTTVDLTVTESGNTTFYSTLSGTAGGSTDDSGIFRGNGGVITQIVREGELAPDGNGTFDELFPSLLAGLNWTAANNIDSVAFYGELIGTSGGVADDSGIFRSSGGTITQIVREGDNAPGSGTFESFEFPGINNVDEVVFQASLAGTSGGTSDDTAIYRASAGTNPNIVEIVREGDTTPGGSGVFTQLNQSLLNDSGVVVFSAQIDMRPDDEGIYRSSGGAITKIVRSGDAVPDGNGTFESFGRLRLNESYIAFEADLTGTSGGFNDDSGLFRSGNGVVTQIVREGQAAPDGNGFFSSLSSISSEDLAINKRGVVAFQARLDGTTGGTNDNSGLFLGNGDELFQIFREGQVLNGALITDLEFEGDDTVSSYSGFNVHGQLAYRLNFANGDDLAGVYTPDLHWKPISSESWDADGAWTLGLKPGHPHDVFIQPAADLTVTGPSSDTTVRSLEIGGGSGLVTLDLQNGAVLTATNGVMIADTGTLTGVGTIEGNTTNDGTIVARNLTVASTLTNNRIIEGSGRIDANIVNSDSGEVRVHSGQQLWLSGPSFSNAGLVEVHGGELRVESLFANEASTGLISVRDGSLIADSLLTNQGSMAMSHGTSIIRGDIINTGTGIIQVSGGAHATFFDDVVQNGTMQVVSIGSTNSAAVMLGAFGGSGGFTGGGDVFALGDLRPGNSPASVLMDGNLFLGASTDTYVELGGLGLGEFDQFIVTGDLSLGGDLSVDLINGFRLTFNDEFLLADVGGTLSNEFFGLGEGDFVGNFGGMDLFITYRAGNGNDVALFTPIPEPGALAFAMLILMAFLACQRKRSRHFSQIRNAIDKSKARITSPSLGEGRKRIFEFAGRAVTVSCLVSLLFGSLLLQKSFGQGRYETIAMTGDPISANRQFRIFEKMQLNNLGQIVFEADTTDNIGTLTGSGVFLYNGNQIQTIARTGNATSDGNFGDSFGEIRLNNQGSVAFSASSMTGTSNGSANDNAVFLQNSTGLIEVAREGDATVDGAYGELDRLQLNNLDQLFFTSTNMTGTSAGITNDQALFRFDGSQNIELVREGDAAPGGGNIGFIGFFYVNNSNQFVFNTGNMSGTAGGITDDAGVFLGGINGIQEIAREGDAALGNGNFGELFNTFNTNGNGDVVFRNYQMTGTSGGLFDDSGLYLFDGNSLTEIAREYDPAPGGGRFTGGLAFPTVVNNSGQVAFVSYLVETVGGSSDNSGIFLYENGQLQQLVQTGDATANGSLGYFDELQLNNSGHVAFWTELMEGTVQGTVDDGAAFITDGIDMIEIRRKGESLAGSTVVGIDRDGLQLNNLGQVALDLELANTDDVIELWTPDLHWRSTSSGDWGQKNNWTLTISPDFVHDVFIDSDADVTVSGPTSATVRSLQIGGGNGLVTLDLQSGGTLAATNGISILSTGTLTGTGAIAGTVINDGTIQAQNLTFTDGITNNTGVIQGNGRIAGGLLTNNPSAAIRAGAGEVLRIDSAAPINLGEIEVIGGEVRFSNLLTNQSNTGLIAGRDATLRFDGGIFNAGAMAFGYGISDVSGDIDNAGGAISISGGAEVTFYDDITQNGIFEVATIGSRISSAVVLGEFSGNGGFTGGGDVFLMGDLRPGNSPASVLMDGNLFLGATTDTYVELGGLGLGEFDQFIVTGNLNVNGDLSVDLINGFRLTFNDEFLIADVGGWLAGEFIGLGEGEVVGNFGGMDLFITYRAGTGNDVALFTAIPEPSLLPIAFLFLVVILARHRNRFCKPNFGTRRARCVNAGVNQSANSPIPLLTLPPG